MGGRKTTLQPYKVNQLTLASQAASFRVDVGGSAGNMRDLYFVFTAPTDTQPMTWNTYFDRFEGGSADAIAPKTGINIYHIYEYASEHFAVEKFDRGTAYAKDITYAELVALKNQGNLTPGMMYTITDYATTTTQANSQATGTIMPLAVIASGGNTLMDDGWIPSKNLHVKYDIDNDTSKYAWADATNGKGVIYWMRDIYGNECPYDFKSIKFKPYDPRTTPTTDYCYTFNGYSGTTFNIDASESGSATNNVIEANTYNLTGVITSTRYLNNIVIFGTSIRDNFFGCGCRLINIGAGVYSSIIGNKFKMMSFNVLTGSDFMLNMFTAPVNRFSCGMSFRQNLIHGIMA